MSSRCLESLAAINRGQTPGGKTAVCALRAHREWLVAAFLAATVGAAVAAGPAAAAELRVCADPQNLPYSRADGAGFENRVMQVVARELGARVTPVWLPEGRGHIRKTLNAGLCDVLAGVPAALDRVRTTAPYYESSYVFVSRADRGAPYRSFDDARLAKARIGVQLIGDDLAATPPGHALAARGLTNVTGYTIHGERAQVERMIEDVASGAVDVAVAWGPQAGYFAARQDVPLHVARADAPPELAQVPFVFAISMGVRKNDARLQHALDAALVRARAEIDAILAEYAVPRVDATPSLHAAGVR
jgi:mxaJ protein